VRLPGPFLARVLLAAALAGAAGWGCQWLITTRHLHLHAAIESAAVLGTFGAAYLVLALLLGIDEARAVIGRFRRRLR
jgi:hypothetical protein